MKIAVSGGHITPALAVWDALGELLTKKGENLTVVFFGRKYSMEGDPTVSVEYKMVVDRGYNFVEVTAGRLQRQFTSYTIPSLFKIPIGFFQCFGNLVKKRVDVIVSFGGYVSVPLVVAGWILRIPIISHEQTVVMGLASKIDAFFADKIAVSFPSSVSKFSSSKVVLTGNPIRKEIFVEKSPNPYKELGFPVVYITGGNQGSHVINMAVLEILTSLLGQFVVIHQCGESKFDDFGKLLHESLKIPEEIRKRYFLFKYIQADEVGSVMVASSIVVGRSGANTITELAVLGKPSVLIPIPFSSYNEQEENAKLLENVGLACVITEKELTGERLLEKILFVERNLPSFLENKEKGKSLVKIDAAERFAEEIYALYKAKKNN